MADPDVRIDEDALARFLADPSGPVGQMLAKLGQRGAQIVKRRAPVGQRNSKLGHPSGYLRSRIGWEMGGDSDGLYVDISSPARTSKFNPFPNEPYGLYNERPRLRRHGVPEWVRAKEGPYMVPGLEELMGTL
jgi:hypothetical protein